MVYGRYSSVFISVFGLGKVQCKPLFTGSAIRLVSVDFALEDWSSKPLVWGGGI